MGAADQYDAGCMLGSRKSNAVKSDRDKVLYA